MLGSEAHFRSTLGRSRAAALLTAMQTGEAESRRLAAAAGFNEPRTVPSVAFDLMTGQLGLHLEPLAGVRKVDSKGQILWIIDEAYALRVKRLGSGYATANHRSTQQSQIAQQGTLDGLPPLVFVSVGPRASTLTGLPEEWAAVRHLPGATCHRVEWVVDLEDMVFGSGEVTTPVLPLPTSPDVPAATVKSTRDRRSEHARS